MSASRPGQHPAASPLGRRFRRSGHEQSATAAALTLLTLALIVLLSGIGSTARATNDPNRPNVLFIVTDDQRFGSIGDPRPYPTTPFTTWMTYTKQWIKDQGTTFNQPFSTTP